jgi:2-methylcitrate dehydratase PrpD
LNQKSQRCFTFTFSGDIALQKGRLTARLYLQITMPENHMTIIEQIAEWAANLQYSDIPDRILEKQRHQILSVIASIHAGSRTVFGKALIEELADNQRGPATIFPNGQKASAETAAYINAALSMSLDYDDYLFLGHTGHSAVCATLAVAESVKASTHDLMVAMAIANEIGGRAGAACMLGPHNGQMWTPLHLLSTAASTARLLGLSTENIAQAMAISLTAPPYPLIPAFMGTSAKTIIAAEPIQTGIRSAKLAAAGLGGKLDIIEHPKGWLSRFTFHPLPEMFTGFGKAWVTDTLTYKQYPGCAYIDSTIDALRGVLQDYQKTNKAALNISTIKQIEIKATFLTFEMDRMSKEFIDREKLLPININFAIPENIAIALITGELQADTLDESFLQQQREQINELAAKVQLDHDWVQTIDLVMEMTDHLDLPALASSLDLGEARRLRNEFSRHLGHSVKLGELGKYRQLPQQQQRFIKGFLKRLARQLFKRNERSFDLGSADLEAMKMPFSSRVTIKLADGRSFSRLKKIPDGAPGSKYYLEVPREKWLREAKLLSKANREKALKIVLDPDILPVAQLAKACSQAPKRKKT